MRMHVRKRRRRNDRVGSANQVGPPDNLSSSHPISTQGSIGSTLHNTMRIEPASAGADVSPEFLEAQAIQSPSFSPDNRLPGRGALAVWPGPLVHSINARLQIASAAGYIVVYNALHPLVNHRFLPAVSWQQSPTRHAHLLRGRVTLRAPGLRPQNATRHDRIIILRAGDSNV
jgi:hypothetical protein